MKIRNDAACIFDHGVNIENAPETQFYVHAALMPLGAHAAVPQRKQHGRRQVRG